jgi:hypothetical protein
MTDVFRGATASRVLHNVTFSSSVRRLTDFCTLMEYSNRDNQLEQIEVYNH